MPLPEQRKYHSLGRLCSVLGVSASGYHDWLDRPMHKTDRDNLRLVTKIHCFHKASRCIYGAPRIHKDLVNNACESSARGTTDDIRPQLVFNERLKKVGFWWLNGGLVLMIFTSLLPIGFLQFHASLSQGLWYARSEEFMQQDLLQTLRWVRTFGDVVFIVGALAVSWQVVIGVFSRDNSRLVGVVAPLATGVADTEEVCCGGCGGRAV